MRYIFLLALVSWSGMSLAEMISFSAGEVIAKQKIEHNESEVNSRRDASQDLVNQIPLVLNSLEQEISKYNTIISWNISNRYHAAGTVYLINWNTYITEEGTYACTFQYRSASPYGNGDLWDSYVSAIVDHTLSGKENADYAIYQTKTAHAFNGKDFSVGYRNYLNAPGQIYMIVTGESRNGTIWTSCKKML